MLGRRGRAWERGYQGRGTRVPEFATFLYLQVILMAPSIKSDRAFKDVPLHQPSKSYWSQIWSFTKANRSIVMGCVLDGFEWYSYAYVTSDIAKAIFNGSDTMSWVGWAVPHIIAPFGAAAFGTVADSSGRKNAFFLSASMLAGSTVLAGLTPIVPVLGPVWMLACRCVTGACYGGKWSMSGVFLAESASTDILAISRFPFIPAIAGGYLLTSLLMVPLYSNLSEQAMVSWGWRVPFLVSGILSIFPILLFAWEAKETPRFQALEEEEGGTLAKGDSILAELQHTWAEFLKDSWKGGLIATGGMLFEAALEGLGDNYQKYWLAKWCGMGAVQAARYTIHAQFVYIPVAFAVLVAADTVGLAKMGLVGAAYGCIASVPLFAVPYFFPSNHTVIWLVQVPMYGVLRAAAMPCRVWIYDMFPTRIRGKAVGVYLNLAFVIGGWGPVFCNGNPMYPAIYLTTCSVLAVAAFSYSLVSAWARKHTPDAEGWVECNYLRADPY